MKKQSILIVAVTVSVLLRALSAHGQPTILQRGYGPRVSGAALNETTLNTSNVTASRFGLVFKLTVDDNIMAQPLYVSNLEIKGASHYALYGDTMSDALYALDVDGGGAAQW